MIQPSILYEDQDILVCHKAAGVASQKDYGTKPDMVSILRNYLAASPPSSAASSGSIPYLGVVHRLDKPVEGILVYGKTKKATSGLSRQVKEKKSMIKIYHALVEGELPVDPPGEVHRLEDYLSHNTQSNLSMVTSSQVPGARHSYLDYCCLEHRTLEDQTPVSLVQIQLFTGRPHQIRIQFSHMGYPIVADAKYGHARSHQMICLCACQLSFLHPVTGKKLEFSIDDPWDAL